MGKAKKSKVSEKKLAEDGMYKGYDMKWLRGIGEDHPDFELVAEFDSKYGDK